MDYENNNVEYVNNTPSNKPNGLTITGFVLSLVGIPFSCCYGLGIVLTITGLVLSIVGMKKNKCGFATAALVISIIAVVISVLAIIYWIIMVGVVAGTPEFQTYMEDYMSSLGY